MGIHRFGYGSHTDCDMPYILFLHFKRKGMNAAKAQGYGAHSQEERIQKKFI
jgi:hypothetical protein